jgi:hypothetical protein
MRKLVALPGLSADALSSVAHGPQAMLAVLVLAGLPGLSYSLPADAAIACLMLAVGVSYRQTIRAHPQGGGSYIVASEELGRVPGLMAAAGLWFGRGTLPRKELHEAAERVTANQAGRSRADAAAAVEGGLSGAAFEIEVAQHRRLNTVGTAGFSG